MNPLEDVKMVDRCGAAEPVKPADRAEPEAQLERIHEALLRPEPTPAVERILHKALDGHRISYEEGCVLMREGDLGSLGLVAGEITRRLHPDNIVTFVVDRNINYTNVCVTDCKFCAFYRHEKDPDAWVLSHEEILQKVGELAATGGTQVLIQGGHHPKLPFEYYTEMCQLIKRHYPQIAIHSFSVSEIRHFARAYKMPVREVVERLKEAGLDSVPGAGGEVLADRPRRIIAPLKDPARDWLETYELIADCGLRGSSTMMFGHVETLEERVEHLLRLREVQDRTAEKHGVGVFWSFICWTFQPGNTPLVAEGLHNGVATSSYEYLRTLAVARIFLDNIPNIQASWVTQGVRIGQISLDCGCNDFGGTMMEENVVAAAGTIYHATPADAIRLIRDAGKIPARRNTFYEILETY
ncbi:cyclic dehypoxanthinyl futalosine synthase [Symbiobacterium thermophilum]|uniref:cyclic dehypoxanthinyl futalosine synthase n=1 Tax=Symbiobacterium thermophilum TaxID=2734 RepID=UPI0030811EEC